MFGDNTFLCIFNDQNNTFRKQSEIVEGVNKLYIGISYFLLMAFVVTSNLMLIYGFYKTSRTFTIITKLFIYLSLVDIVLSLLTTLYAVQSFLDLILISRV